MQGVLRMSYQYRGAQPVATDPEVQAEAPLPAAGPEPASGSKPALLPCGTNAAYGRHLNKGEKPCPACTQAHTEYTAERRNTPPEKRRRPEAKCGTPSGAARHWRNKEPACEPCAESRREYERERAARKKLIADAQQAYDEAMQAHPDNAVEGQRRRKELNRELELAAAHARAVSGTPLAEAA